MDAFPEIEVAKIPSDPAAPARVLDVREDDEWDAGHIDGALHIAMSEIPGRLAELPTDGQIIVVCRVGARSARVTAFLANQGIDAVNLAGGMQAWAAAGRQLTSSTGAPPEVI